MLLLPRLLSLVSLVQTCLLDFRPKAHADFVPACPRLNSSFLSFSSRPNCPPPPTVHFSGGFHHSPYFTSATQIPCKSSFSPSLENSISHQILLIILLPLSPCTLLHPLHSRPLFIQFLVISCLDYCSTSHFKFYTTVRVNFLVSHISVQASSFPA